MTCLVIGASALATAQTSSRANTNQSQTPSDQTSSNSPAGTNADENFELNISERRITRSDYNASTSVEAGEENTGSVHLRVGVEVGASEIDVLLRNVQGRVRFRASLDRILDLINAHQTPNPTP
jgi:hypothetical protein